MLQEVQQGNMSFGRLGDDSTTIYTDVSSPVPIPVPADTSSLTPTQALVYNSTQPFIQAAASLLAHGQTPAGATVASPFGVGTSSAWVWIFGIGAVAAIAWAISSSHRR